MAYTDPVFTQYSPALARHMTEWLYADPANPTFRDESKWATGPRVQLTNRTLSFANVALAAGTQSTQTLSITGGKNAIIFSRMASARPAAAATAVLPNERSSYVQCQVTRTDGFIEVENQPITLAWGTVPGMPFVFPIPLFWFANLDRTIQVTNNTGVVTNVDFGWLIATLDTGR